jgi:hypothetical protein
VSGPRDSLGGHGIDDTACSLDGIGVGECQGGIDSEGMALMIQHAHWTVLLLTSVRTEGFPQRSWH